LKDGNRNTEQWLRLKIGEYNQNDSLKTLPAIFKVTMRINQQTLGTLAIDKKTMEADLSVEQTAA